MMKGKMQETSNQSEAEADQTHWSQEMALDTAIDHPVDIQAFVDSINVEAYTAHVSLAKWNAVDPTMPYHDMSGFFDALRPPDLGHSHSHVTQGAASAGDYGLLFRFDSEPQFWPNTQPAFVSSTNGLVPGTAVGIEKSTEIVLPTK